MYLGSLSLCIWHNSLLARPRGRLLRIWFRCLLSAVSDSNSRLATGLEQFKIPPPCNGLDSNSLISLCLFAVLEIIRADINYQLDLDKVSAFFSVPDETSEESVLADVTNVKKMDEEVTVKGKKRRMTTGGTEFSALTQQRALALMQTVSDEVETYKSLYEKEKSQHQATIEKCQVLEAALAVRSSNTKLSHSLITSVGLRFKFL